MHIHNKNILITGAARGLGLAMTQWFASRGNRQALFGTVAVGLQR